MKKVIFTISLIILLSLIACPLLASCSFVDIDWDINDGFDNDDLIEPSYSFIISANDTELTIEMSNIGVYGANGRLVALPSYKYLYGETVRGLSAEVEKNPVFIDDYECGTAETVTIDRYFDEVDGIYYKYYVLSDTDTILAGPVYCTQITPKYTHEDPIITKGIKGVMCENLKTDMVADLGCSFTELNFWIDNMFVPNEVYENGQVIPLTYQEETSVYGTTITRNGVTEEVDYIDYNGQRYYFRMDSISFYDDIISWYTQRNVKVTLIVLLNNVADKYKQPYFITYPATEGSTKHVQFNTSNAYGAGYWGAFMEFLGNRYSQSAVAQTSKYGLVQTYVLGNEIDMASSWNNIVGQGQPALTLENYIEEYEREMRIANQALKKYYPLNKVLVSITHLWADKGEEYSPKDILDYLTKKTIAQGNYDYGFAIHPYGKQLDNAAFWRSDTSTVGMNGSLTTSAITWSNLEVIQLYLEQPSKLCNGEIRSVYLTEGGVASTSGGLSQSQKTRSEQAAGVAYAYYKSSQLSCIKAFIYYRLLDHAGDGTYFGLVGNINEESSRKPAYYLYKYIDTQYSFEVSQQYISNITWSMSNGWQSVSHGYGIDCDSYQDLMKIFDSRFDWSTHWNEDLIIVRNINEGYVPF